jgi:MOSC domain-containing protein
MAPGRVGAVAGLARFPVKSMGGERLEEAQLTDRGIVGDRAFAILDVETGKVASAKSVRLFPHLLRCKATFVEWPRAGRELPPARITMPDGRVAASDSPDVDRTLSACFGRDVRLAHTAPDDFTIDMVHPDIESADPAARRDQVAEQKLGSAFFDAHGIPSPVPVGAFFDLYPMSLLTTSTLARLAELAPRVRFDPRRFRMNVIIDAGEAGFPENGWVGRDVALGDTVRLRIAKHDLRCVMTTLAQDELPNDPEVLRALVRHNRIQVGEAGHPCAGVYAVVGTPGTLRIGDPVTVL